MLMIGVTGYELSLRCVNSRVSKVSKIVLAFFMMSESEWTADENILFFSERGITIKLPVKNWEGSLWQNNALMMYMLTNTERRYMGSVEKSRICEASTIILTQETPENQS